MNDRKILLIEQGWEVMEKGIKKLERILEGLPEPPFNSNDYLMLYVTIYNMCTQPPPHDYSEKLYDKYKQVFVDYLTEKVLPSLREKHDEVLLRELVKRWSNHKQMVRWMPRFFHYLDRYFIPRRSLPSLSEVGYTCFRELVYQEISGKTKDAVIALIDVEREGGQIDRALLKNVLDVYVDIGMGSMDYYENDFETPMLENMAAYYSRKASSWILEDSCSEYMLKSEECLKNETDRVDHYLHSNSGKKVLERVQNELLLVFENKLLEKENSGAPLIDVKVEDLSRMYRLFSKFPKGLESIDSVCKQHVIDEAALVRQAEDAALSEADENVGSSYKQGSDILMSRKILKIEQGWEVMEKGIKKLERILEGLPEPPFNSEDYLMLYAIIYNMCTQPPPHDYSEKLYDKYKQVFVDYLTEKVLPSLREKHDEVLLTELVKRWSNHKQMVRWMPRFFHYLDRYFIPRGSLPSLSEVGYTSFRELVYQEISGKAKDAVIASIHVERDGGQIDRALLKNVLDVYVDIGKGSMDYYENDFETPMLQSTTAYYSRQASSWILEDSCSEYMLKVEERLKKETDMVDLYIHSNTGQKLLEQVQNELLLVYGNKLLEKENSGCRTLLKDNKVDDLSRMYRLYSKVPGGLEHISSIFKQHITDEGTALVQQAEHAALNKTENAGSSHVQVFIRKVIELHDSFMAYVTDPFQSDTIFHKALKEAFEVFLKNGVSGSSSAQLLATFCDNILKKEGNEILSDEAIDDSLEKAVKLLAYVSHKDLFAEFYRNKLSHRLLFDKSANDYHERSMLTKLKQQYGGMFTLKMDGMVTDFTFARENQTNFEQYLRQNSATNPGLDLTLTVLTPGFWPNYKSSNLNLPDEMVKCVEICKQFYQTKTQHRKLTWVYSLSSCTITGKFSQKTIELVVGTYQAAVLMLFNSSDRLSYSEIAAKLNLADEDLVRVLKSLSCAKHKILNKEPSTRTVSTTDYFSFNSSFTSRMRRITIPLALVNEKKEAFENVVKDRRYAIDASIVRIMRNKKVLARQQLICECFEQLSPLFKPDFRAIKMRIENLITRDYIERDKENPQLFRYLA